MADVIQRRCVMCSHLMELVTRERSDKTEPPEQWECTCSHHEPVVPAKEWGEA